VSVSPEEGVERASLIPTGHQLGLGVAEETANVGYEDKGKTDVRG
jgi:hypothetical protein